MRRFLLFCGVTTMILMFCFPAHAQKYEYIDIWPEPAVSSVMREPIVISDEPVELVQPAPEACPAMELVPSAPEIAEPTSKATDKTEREAEQEAKEKKICLGKYTFTAFCACEKCCGTHSKTSHAVGAAGTQLEEGRSAAGWLPFFTEIEDETGHRWVIEDRTDQTAKEMYDGKIIDLYFEDHQRARNFGTRKMTIYKIVKE